MRLLFYFQIPYSVLNFIKFDKFHLKSQLKKKYLLRICIFFGCRCNFSNSYHTVSIDKRLRKFFLNKHGISIFCKIFENNFGNSLQFLNFLKNKKKINKYFSTKYINSRIEIIRKGGMGKIHIVALYYFTKSKVQFFRIRYYILYCCNFPYCFFSDISIEIYKIVPEKYFLYQRYSKICQIYKIHKIAKFKNCTVFWKKIYISRTIFEGYLIQKGCSVFITIFEYFLHINDSLILTNNILLIDDKGFDENFIPLYGNLFKLFFHLNKKVEGEWDDFFFL